MEDIKNNTDNSNNEKSDFDEIYNLKFKKVTFPSAIASSLGMLNPIMSSMLSTALSGISDEELTDAIERSKLQRELQILVKEAQQTEAKTWSSVIHDADTSVLINIYNGTSERFSLTRSSWNIGESALTDLEIAPWHYLSLILHGESPRLAGGRQRRGTLVKLGFTYASRNQAFDFSSSIGLSSPYDPFSFESKTVPHREHNVRSIGNIPIVCQSHLTRKLDSRPYSYAVTINLS